MMTNTINEIKNTLEEINSRITEAKEVDINLSYSYKNFSVTVSDYWWAGANMP